MKSLAISERQLKLRDEIQSRRHAMLQSKHKSIKLCAQDNPYLDPLCKQYDEYFEKHEGDEKKLKDAFKMLLTSLNNDIGQKKMGQRNDNEEFIKRQIKRIEKVAESHS